MKKHLVIGLDGVPYSLLKQMFEQGVMPFLCNLSQKNQFKELKSVLPTVSSVAWTSFATGMNPAEHNIFGFVDRRSNPFELFLPNSNTRRKETIWKKLSDAGRQVIVVNVPMTYPPEEVNGIMISCFLCPSLEKGTYPEALHHYLEEKGYVIDADARIAAYDLERFLEELFLVMNKRFEVAKELLVKNNWDYFHLHIMETDRLLHFFWHAIEKEDNVYHERVIQFFKVLDDQIREFFTLLERDTGYTILSDHGFCGIKYEVQMNKWLEKEKLLAYQNDTHKTLEQYKEMSLSYSLIPGRFYINLKNREEYGSVEEDYYDSVKKLLTNKLLNMRSPEGEPVIEKVYDRGELYFGEAFEYAADLIAKPANGFDLKARTDCEEIFSKTHLTGMHTYDDAFILSKGYDNSSIDSITDVSDYIYKEIME